VGRGVYEQDSELRRVLRIELANDADCELVICEESWNGEIRSGEEVGCDFLIPLTYSVAESSSGLSDHHCQTGEVPSGDADAAVSAELARATA